MPRRQPAADAGASPPPAALALLALPPAGFVAAREALARELADRGDPAAAAVRKLRRPVGRAWLLNHLARQERGSVDALLHAGDRLRAAQAAALAGQGADEFRAAEEELRAAARALRLSAAPALAAAGTGETAAALAHLEVELRFLAGAPPELRERFRAGLLEREPEVGAVGLTGAFAAAGPARLPAPKPRERLRPPAVQAASAARAGRRLEARRADGAKAQREGKERRRAAKEAQARAREAARAGVAAARVAARAEQRASRARRELDRAEARASAARAALAAAEEDVQRSRVALQQARPGPTPGSSDPTHTHPSADDAVH